MFLEVYPQVLGTSTLKRCTKCGEYKPADSEHFNRSKRQRDGLHGTCLVCRAAYREANRERDRAKDKERYYADHEATLARKKENYWKNPEARRESTRKSHRKHIEKRRAYDKVYNARHYAENAEYLRQWQREYHRQHPEKRAEYQAANADKLREKAREYGRNNAEKRSEYNKRFWKANPDKRRIKEHRRRALKANAPGRYSVDELAAIRAAQTDSKGRLICWACGKPIKGTPHLDHWIPLDKAGSNSAGNLHFMHARCNLSKGAKHPTEIGRLI